jgi:hypothetical protein
VLKVEIKNKKIETDMLDGDGQQDIVIFKIWNNLKINLFFYEMNKPTKKFSLI